VKNIDGYAGQIEMGSGELVGILGHLDVVPEGDGWSVPPYGGIIQDEKIYGRGALDDKGPTLAVLYAMKAIRDANLPLVKTVRLILGTDEESGWTDMKYYKGKEEIPQFGFAPDAEFPLIHAEKGILHLEFSCELPYMEHIVEISAGERANIVPDLCRMKLRFLEIDLLRSMLEEYSFPDGVSARIEEVPGEELRLVFSGVSAHGSLPQNGKNAAIYALKFLQALPLNLEEKDLLNWVLNYPGQGVNGEGFGIAFSDEPSGKLSLNLGILTFKDNKFSLVIDIRYPVTFSEDQILKPIRNKLFRQSMRLNIRSSQHPHYVPKDSPFIQSLLDAYSLVTGLKPYAFAIGGGTYAKVLPQGVAFGPVLPGEPEVIHCPDEYISINNLILTTKVYTQAILNLALDPNYKS
nr:dipeptidase PepV [Desulfitobacterium hafniense]